VFAGLEAWLGTTRWAKIAILFQASAFAIDGFALFLVTYRLLTPGKGIRPRGHLPGAVAFTITWMADGLRRPGITA